MGADLLARMDRDQRGGLAEALAGRTERLASTHRLEKGSEKAVVADLVNTGQAALNQGGLVHLHLVAGLAAVARGKSRPMALLQADLAQAALSGWNSSTPIPSSPIHDTAT